MRFDRPKFFAAYRDEFGSLDQKQVDGLTFILDAAEQDPHLTDVRWLGYMLATTKHETADTFQPVHEYGVHAYFVKRYGGQTALGKRLGNDTPEEGALYAGEGDVQLTGESNYEKAEAALRREYPEIIADFQLRTGKQFDLTVGDQPNDEADPSNAADPAIAYAIMSYGMRTGMFTGRKLSDYINGVRCDYIHARQIINGFDKAALIGGYANGFEKILIVSAASSAIDPPISPAIVNTQSPQDPATPPPNSPEVEVKAETANVLTKIDGVGDKWKAIQATLEKFGISDPAAARSKGTVVMTVLKWITSGLLIVAGFVKDNWEYLVLAAFLIGLAVYLWDRSGKRLADAKAGVPVEVLKDTK